jgi:glycosyltransferase involved in cell wall biosynthesis
MRIGFYAPLKPPVSPKPSGDRRMARLFLKCFKARGHEARVTSRMRGRDGIGDPARQSRMQRLGARLAGRLIRRYAAPGAWRPDIWFTYHLFYKAPDWIGPVVARALSIPYVVAEASHAPKRATGPWRANHQQVEHALRQADLVIGLNRRDRACVDPVLGRRTRYVTLRPFLDREPGSVPAREVARARLASRHGLPADTPWLLAVGMMRADAKLESYRVLAAALDQMKTRAPGRPPWRLIVIGDGPARPQVEAALGPQTVFTGALSQAALADYYAAADLFVWPSVREAYGMALLEAQAAGLPAVAGDTGGVPDILRDGRTGLLCPVGDAAAFARAMATLIDDTAARRAMGAAARAVVAAEHDFAAAATRIDALLRETIVRHAAIP